MEEVKKTKHLTLLCVLLGLFLVRVLSQLLQRVGSVAFLPEFEAWHSATLDYEVLLASQTLIVVWCLLVINGVRRDSIKCTLGKARRLLVVGALYFAFMLFRLIASLTFAEEGSWFDSPLPSLFHLVLALFVLCHGHYHWAHRSAQT